MRRIVLGLSICVVLAAAYVAWPFAGLVLLGSALHAADASESLERIDVASVRRSLVEQLLAAATKDETIEAELDKLGDFERQLALRAATAELDRRAALIITPEALNDLIANGRLPKEWDPSAGEGAGNPVPGIFGVPENPLRFIQTWRFSSLRTFKTVLGETGADDNWVGLSLRLNGLTWRLTDITLPKSLIQKIQPVIRQELQALRGRT